MPSKARLRESLKEARLSMSDTEHVVKSQAIVQRLKLFTNWSAVRSLHYYEPLRELLEVDTSGLITDLEDKYPDLQLCVPRLIEGEWRLIAARGGGVPAKFDVIIVPMLGFDPVSLHRIGYGGGYYDKFLASQPQARKIGVCFEAGKLDGLPTEPHDVPLDAIITETRVYTPAHT